MNKVSLAIIISHPIQHFAPLYQLLAQQSAMRVKVFFVAENGVREYQDAQFGRAVKWDVPLTEGYEHEFIEPGKILDNYGFFAVDSTIIGEKLADFSPDFIWLHGYAQRINWRALFTRLQRHDGQKIEHIYSSDSNTRDTRSWWKRAIKRVLIRRFFSRCDWFLSISPNNTEYLEHYGVDPAQIIETAFPVDITRLQTQAETVTRQSIDELRSQLSITHGQKVALFAGKLIPHKRPQDLLEALALLESQQDQGFSGSVVALFVGSGELESSLKALAKELGVAERVRFAGFVNQSELANYFSLADVFVFTSSKEPYGAIAAEVLPFGLPIIAADRIGAVGASIIEGENALLYSCGDTADLAAKINTLLSSEGLYQRFSAYSRGLAMQHDRSVMANAIVTICLSDN